MAVLEDDPNRVERMRAAIDQSLPMVEAIFFDNAPDMIDWLTDNLSRVSLLCLDHDLGPNRQREGEVFDPGIGRDVVRFLEEQAPCCPVCIHSSNGPAADVMFFALQHAGWAVERVVPFRDLEWVDSDWIGRIQGLAWG